MRRHIAAFTLVELLAVVAVIAIISTLSLGPIHAAQIRSRDTQRKTDVNLIAQALDLFYADKHALPTADLTPPCETLKSFATTDPNWIPDLAPYIPTTAGKKIGVPKDPLDAKTKEREVYYYTYACSVIDGRSYKVTTTLENSNDMDGDLVGEGTDQHRVYTIER